MSSAIRDLKTTMHNLNASNERTQRFLLVLTVVAVIVGAIQAAAAILSICR
jgi:predicted lysophospholipase L1 biosynthesis ABC-type transport system permease subunit